jgi:hypothetical protein
MFAFIKLNLGNRAGTETQRGPAGLPLKKSQAIEDYLAAGAATGPAILIGVPSGPTICITP